MILTPDYLKPIGVGTGTLSVVDFKSGRSCSLLLN